MRMRWSRSIGLWVILTAGFAGGAAIDPAWMFVDSMDVVYGNFRYCDTARVGNYNCFALDADAMPDTGDSYDGSRYINFGYKFTADSFIVRDEYDSTVIHYRDLRPGYAGFKTAWDGGLTGFALARYKYLIFAHKGPLPNHKVTVRAWYNDGSCGAPSFNEDLGTVAASATWKIDTIVIPESIRNKPDKERNGNVYYEFVFLINNLNSKDTASSGPGSFKVDNIRLVGCNPIDSSPVPQQVTEGQATTMRVSAKYLPGSTLAYQWQKDGVPVAGAVSPVYTIASVKSAQAGVYTAVVTVAGTGYAFTSQPATLTVIAETAAGEKSGCGCGAGTGLALLPPLWFRTMANRKRKKRRGNA